LKSKETVLRSYEHIYEHLRCRNQNWDSTYSNVFCMCNPEELTNWDGIVSRNVSTNIFNSWNLKHDNQYNSAIVNTTGIRQVLTIKGSKKLCSHYSEIPRNDPRCNPNQKYQLVWYVMTHNINQCVERGGLDLSLEETTWPSGLYAGMHHRL
jgi:hypothetical protein